MIPRPAGCLLTKVTSPGPLTTKLMLASSPLCEKTHTSAVPAPLDGRTNGTGLPASVQELLVVLNAPSAATFRSISDPVVETPAVVGSTTTMSFPVALGAPLDSVITANDVFCA